MLECLREELAGFDARPHLVLCILALYLTFMSSDAGAQEGRILDRPVDVFETGLAVLSPDYGQGYWIDRDRLLVNALQEGTKESPIDYPLGADTRVMLVDFKSRRMVVVADHEGIHSFDPRTSHAYFGGWPATAGRQVRVDVHGTAVEIRDVSPAQRLSNQMVLPKDRRVSILELVTDGYLVGDPDPGSQHLFNGEIIPTTWIRPGKPPIRLPVSFEEIGPMPRYVPFLGKYLLHETDSRKNSNTNGAERKKWNRPYMLTPYRLLSMDGTIEEIPFPRFISDFNFKYVNQLLLTRPGIVVYTWEAPPGPGIYLYEKGILYRLSKAAVVSGAGTHQPLDTSLMGAPTVSPDGCRIAYEHSPMPAELTHLYTPRQLAVVDICAVK